MYAMSSGNGIDPGPIETSHSKTLKGELKTPVEKENPLCRGEVVPGKKQEALSPSFSGN
jgi:hypothetical protein